MEHAANYQMYNFSALYVVVCVMVYYFLYYVGINVLTPF